MSRLGRIFLGLFPTASIGSYLATMAILATLPLLAFVVFLLLQLERSQFQALRADAAQDAQTISRGVERKLADMETTLALIANSVELQQGDLSAFHARVAESLKDSSLYVILARRDGIQVLNTRMPWGAPLRPMANPGSVVSALRSGNVELSDVFLGATSQRWVVNLTMPLVERGPQGADAAVLTQDAESFVDLASRDSLPPGWTSALLDNQGRMVVSNGVDHQPAGTAMDPSWLELMYGANGSAVYYKDGQQYLMGYAKLPDWRWHAVVWGPADSLQGSFVDLWKSLLTGSVVFLALIMLVVSVAAHHLRSAIRKIACMAERIGEGDIVSPERTKIVEANQVAVALSNASFDRAEAEERIHFILQELVHRTKNILSLVQAMMRQLARGTDDVEDFQRAVSGRLAGLAQSIEALAKQQWAGIALSSLVELQLTTVTGSFDRVSKRGPELLVNANAVQNLGLVFHELATNSVKYGALSVLEGRLRIEWQVLEPEAEGDEQRLRLTWTELHGPPVTAPTRRGFGSTVIERHAASAFAGEVTLDFNSNGLRWTLVAPLSSFTVGTAD
ncbi:sensor histidine kinase [Rhizobium rhizophilum]|uniref:histidine kinase n=1 Tax=Rhizobium rhizophilum TaxID=1850373 RepID=A0ABY2R1G0_9HYPH|nr:sensor histidine kinase [Rhizobium rhizophilum]THV17014.1 histidine kinase [Rhizobium rhizophilum]